MDIEVQTPELNAFINERVRSFSWTGLNIDVGSTTIIDNANGRAKAGQFLAIMGPSGCGKTTLLTALAQRPFSKGFSIYGCVLANDQPLPRSAFRRISTFVEQDDTLIGSLTVRETLDCAGRLSLPASVSKADRGRRVDALLAPFGLRHQEGLSVGTPIRKGISGGQKRRLSIASQLIGAPKIVLLDEPTSGLDSVASFEVVAYLREMVGKTRSIVVASIHQPSTAVFNLFDDLMLMSQGETAYFGEVDAVRKHFEALGFEISLYANPAESLLDILSTDFRRDDGATERRLKYVLSSWHEERPRNVEAGEKADSSFSDKGFHVDESRGPNPLLLPITLIHRSLIKSYRDVVVYGIRVAMYIGLAVMMGTVWLRLEPHQDSIQSYINAIFFQGAFMSFMAVAYIPAYLEDRALYVKERANGLYGPGSFIVANFFIGLPYLFIICVLFSVIAYWLSGFRSSAEAFFTWIMWLYLDLLAAESLVVLISSLVPIFVVALAATAFANGLWMSVGGFLVPTHILNVFWRYVFHYIDYQAYVFQGMMVNEFADRTYSCGTGCHCTYDSPLADQCQIAGTSVLHSYGYYEGKTGQWAGILLAIIVVYRLLGWLVLWLRKT